MDGGGGGAPPALEKNAAELTVMDVYDIASAVGQEFERVIDQHGCEAIARLMPKVVRVLEILEVLVSRNHINPEMEELRLELDRLRLERMDRIEKERKHQKVRAGAGGGGRGGAGLLPPAAVRPGGEPGPGPSAAAVSPPRAALPRAAAGENKEGGWGAGRDAAEPVGSGRGTRVGTAGTGSRALRGCCRSVAVGLGVLLCWFWFGVFCCFFFLSLLEVSFLLPFLHPFPGHCVSFPLCLPD